MKPRYIAIATVALTLSCAALQAKPSAADPAPSAQTAVEGDPASEAERARLNRLTAEKARLQIDENTRRNEAAMRAYNDAVAAREAQIQRDQEAARQRQAAYDAAMAQWRADVEACKQGHHRRCAAMPGK